MNATDFTVPIATAKWDNNPYNVVTPTHYKAEIEKVANGFIVKVGCKTFVSESWAKITKALGEYWDNPKKAEVKYTKCNKKRR